MNDKKEEGKKKREEGKKDKENVEEWEEEWSLALNC